MIELKALAYKIQSDLNAVFENSEQPFKIFADLGDFQNYYKAQNSNDPTYYVNGILESLTPSILPIRNLQVLTQTIRLTLALDVELLNKDENGNFVEVTTIRQVLSKYIKASNGKPFAMEEIVDATNQMKMTYEVTPTFSGISVGTISQLSPIGEILPMYLDATYTFIESGINSNSVEVFLNGESLYFEKASVSRVRLAESNTFAGQKSTKTVIQNNGLSIDLNAPLLDTPQSDVIENDVLDGGNNIAQCVQYVRGDKVRNYIMVFGNTTENLEMAKNIGTNVSLVEGKQDILAYNEKWQTYSVTVSANEEVTIGTAVSKFKGVAFFGDGTSDDSSVDGTFTHTYENAGTYIVRVFNYYNLRVVTFYVDDEIYEQQEVDYGDLAEILTPTKTGFDFDGWYTEDTYTNQFNFSTPITNNVNLYGRFLLDSAKLKIDVGTDTTLTINRTSSPYGEGTIGVLSNNDIIYNGDVLNIVVDRIGTATNSMKTFIEFGNTTNELLIVDTSHYEKQITLTKDYFVDDEIRICSTTNEFVDIIDASIQINKEGETTFLIDELTDVNSSIFKFSANCNGYRNEVAFTEIINNKYSGYILELENISLLVELLKTNNTSITFKVKQTIENEDEYIATLNPLTIYKLTI